MATAIQSGYRSPSELSADSMKGIPKSGSETQLKEKKSLGKKIKDFFKAPFTKKASTATDIPLDQRTDISGSQNFEQKAHKAHQQQLGWNPYQHPAHGQIFVPGSIAVIRNGNETVAYVPGNIAVAINRPGMDMNAVPMLLAQNATPVQEIDQVMEETPNKLEGEQSPKFEIISPKYNPVDVAAKIDDVEHMNEKEAEMYKDMRESRMLYASNTMTHPQQPYVTQPKKATVKLNDGRDTQMRESRQYH